MNATQRFFITLIAALVLVGCEEQNMTEPKGEEPVETPDAPLVTVTNPAGGETVTDTTTIRWIATDPDPGETELLSIDLDYSINAGFHWLPIDSNETNDGIYLWNIAGLPESADYLVRITASDTTGRAASDTSNGVFTVSNRIIIVDGTGKEWDITHAFHRYNMQPENFNFGLGPYAIRPLIMPEMLSPGETGYPDDSSTVNVIGTSINGDARAYAIAAVSAHEVVNDVIGGVPAAVIY